MTPFNHKKELNRIIGNYVSGKATPEEIKFIEAYYQHLDKGKDVLNQLAESERLDLENETFEAIKAKITPSKRKVIPLYIYAAAALILVSFAILALYKVENAIPIFKQEQSAKIIDVLPGVDKAILTLADGSKVVLDDQTKGEISEHAGVIITKTDDGQLIYKVNHTYKASSVVAFNTIETPKGGQYQVLLPDGTKVWLNAASSLKYPEVFAGRERKVELTGEAYFEVAKDRAHPFKVISKNQEIEVLGTHFNVNTYMDEKAIKTTLLEGSIKVNNLRSTEVLQPGDQAFVADNGLAAIKVIAVDVNDETAWKNGEFRFNNAGLKSILNQLERWYDVKIDYKNIPNKRYNGIVSRKAKLSEVLKMLELTGNINFEIEENKSLKVLTN